MYFSILFLDNSLTSGYGYTTLISSMVIVLYSPLINVNDFELPEKWFLSFSLRFE